MDSRKLKVDMSWMKCFFAVLIRDRRTFACHLSVSLMWPVYIFIEFMIRCFWWMSARLRNKHMYLHLNNKLPDLNLSWLNSTLSPILRWITDVYLFTFQLLHCKRGPEIPVFTTGQKRRERSGQWVFCEFAFLFLFLILQIQFYYFSQ